MKSIIVMKFGGTSVAHLDSVRRIVELVRLTPQFHPLIVVSALSGVTNQLTELVDIAVSGGAVTPILEELRQRHHHMADELLINAAPVRAELNLFLDDLTALIHDIQRIGAAGDRERDRILGYGERLSSRLVTGLLRDHFDQVALVDADRIIVAETVRGEPETLDAETSVRVAAILEPTVRRNRVTLIQGFIATTRHGAPITLGRGGSDFTATYLAAHLNAERVEIWTDTSGVLTADPRLIPDAQTIPQLSYEEAGLLAGHGAKVLHHRCIEPLIKDRIPLRVRNTFQPEGEETHILAQAREPRFAVTGKSNVNLIHLDNRTQLDPAEFRAKVQAVAQTNLAAVDGIAQTDGRISLAVAARYNPGDFLQACLPFADIAVQADLDLVFAVTNHQHRTPPVEHLTLSIPFISGEHPEWGVVFVVPKGTKHQIIASLHHAWRQANAPKTVAV